MSEQRTVTREALAAALPHNLVAYGKHVEADELADFIFAGLDNEQAGSRLGSTTPANAVGPSLTETKARALGLRDVAPARNAAPPAAPEVA